MAEPAGHSSDGPLHLLLIEDNAADAFLFQEHLSDAEPRPDVQVAHRLADGLAHAAHHPVDCVLMDLSLPDADGLEAVEAFTSHPGHPAIVVLTGLRSPEVAHAVLASGAQDCLEKGAHSAAQLLHRVEVAIDRHRRGLPAPGSAPVDGGP